MSRVINIRDLEERRSRNRTRAFLAALGLTALGLFVIPLSRQPEQASQLATKPEVPTAQPTTQPTPEVQRYLTGAQALALNIKPGLGLTERLRQIYFEDDKRISESYDCTNNGTAPGVKFDVTNDVNLREDPTETSKVVGRFKRGLKEPVTAQLLIKLSSKKVTKTDFVRDWVALIDKQEPPGLQILFVAEKQGLKSYLLKQPSENACTPIPVPDYLSMRLPDTK